MTPELLVPLSVFAAAMFGVWAMFSIFTKKQSRVAQRLEEMRDPTLRRIGQDDNGAMNNIIERAAPTLSRALDSGDEDQQNSLKLRLANAGFSNPNASRNFLAIKIPASRLRQPMAKASRVQDSSFASFQ